MGVWCTEMREITQKMDVVLGLNSPSLHLSHSYFESGVCSVYLWDLDHGFAGVVLIKKAGDTEKIKGCWDSIHVMEVQVCPVGRPAVYQSFIPLPPPPFTHTSGEGAGSQRPLQADVNSDVVAADHQGRLRDHEPGGLPHTPGGE